MKNEIYKKLTDLKKYAELLKKYSSCTEKDLEKDMTLRGAVERYMQIALEIVLEIGEMIIATKGFRKPQKYRDVIEILGDEGVLPKKFAKKFAPAAGFRNILVHRYAEVDLEELYLHLKNDIKDFDTFARHIARYVKKKQH